MTIPSSLRLYYNEKSICSSMVRMTALEKGLTVVMQHLDLTTGEQLSPTFLKINAKGQVPVLVISHGGEPDIVPDSRAITHRLEQPDIGGLSLAPGGGSDPAWAWVDRVHLLNFFYVTFCGPPEDGKPSRGQTMLAGAQKQLETMVQKHPEMADVVKAKLELMKSVKRGTITQQELQETWEGFDAFFGALDNELAQTGKVFVTGDAFSVADAHVAPVLARVTSLGRSELISSRPALQTYWECMQQRPSFKAVFPTGMK